MMYIFYTIKNKGLRPFRVPMLIVVLATFSPSVTAVHGDDLLTCEKTGTTADWSDPEHLNELIDGLRDLHEDGLNPDVYPLRELSSAREHFALWGSLSGCEKQLAEQTYHRALLDLRIGRVDPLLHNVVWQSPSTTPVNRHDVLSSVLSASDGSPAQAFRLARPDDPRYVALREAYRWAYHNYPSSWPVIASGPTLVEGMEGTRVQELKERLREQGYLQHPSRGDSNNPRLYDTATADAVRRFQEDFNLIQDGRAGKATIQALNIQPAELTDTLRANLERLRWPFNEPVKRGLVIDITDATATLYDKGQAIWRNRVQVGKPGRETPEVRSLITHITLYPAWNIPKSIFVNDMLPRIRSDPGYLESRNIRVLDHSGNELPPEPADWPSPAGVRLQQQPGASNPLGTIAIRFSNPFEVYLHDTPADELFRSPERYYSNGCVRVEGAESLARTLFGLHNWRVAEPFDHSLASGETGNVQLPRSVPVLMTYRTALTDEDKTLQFRRDSYQRDRQLINLLDRPEPAR